MKTKFLSASKINVKVDKKLLMKDLSKGPMAKKIKEFMSPKVEEAQREMLEEFRSHPVTIELKQGQRGSNISGLLGGSGNLFSFIGFESGSNPIKVIENILSKDISIHKVSKRSSSSYTVSLIIPSKDEIYASTPIPWSRGRSWVDGIEKGISGLGSYIYSASGFGDSRSGTGIQSSTKKTSGVKFRNTPYLSKILNNFKKNISKK